MGKLLADHLESAVNAALRDCWIKGFNSALEKVADKLERELSKKKHGLEKPVVEEIVSKAINVKPGAIELRE